jgi:hypothetical protein
MKPIMHLYSDKVTITVERELLPLAKTDSIYVAGSPESGIIYTNVPKEALDKLIVEGIKTSSHFALLKLAIETSNEIKTIPNLEISEEGKVVVEDTVCAKVLMTNRLFQLIIVGVDGKVYTNNTKIANMCIQRDLNNGEIEARLLSKLIEVTGGLVECEMKVMR